MSRRWMLRVCFLPATVLALATASAQSLRVDFNGASAQTVAGFQAYTAQHEVAASRRLLPAGGLQR